MAIKLKNEVFNKGFIQGLSELQSKIDFDGDVAWELALFAQDVNKQAKAYEEAINNARKSYSEIHDALIKKLGRVEKEGDEPVIPRDSENYNLFLTDGKRLEAEKKVNEQIAKLNSKEVEYSIDKIVLTKSELKGLKLKSSMFTSLFDILDVR